MERKSHTWLAAIVAIIIVLLLNQPVKAQEVTEVGDITFGGGISQGSSVGLLDNAEYGITLQIYYGILEEVRGGFGYTYYFISESGLSASEINLDGHFFFRNRDNVIFYGLGGINVVRDQVDEEEWGDAGDNTFGLNAGVGLELNLGNLSLFGEPKYTIGGWNQFKLTLGARFRI